MVKVRQKGGGGVKNKVRKYDKNSKTSDFVSLNLPSSLYSKAFEW